MGKLTALQVRNLKPATRTYRKPDGKGLYLSVTPQNKKSWIYRYKIKGNESLFTIGHYPDMALSEARHQRKQARGLVKQGINPSHKRKEEQKIKAEQAISKTELEAKKQPAKNSFQNIALEWIGQQSERWSISHTNHVQATLEKDVFPYMGAMPVDGIKPPQVLEVIRAVEQRGALEIARKVLQRMNAVFRYAVQTGQCTFNPAAEMTGVIKTRRRQHMNALKQGDLPEFFERLHAADIFAGTKLAILFTLLTAARTSETRLATWEEIDLEGALWRIPAERMKMSTPHNVPLSSQTVAILKRAARLFGTRGYLFPSPRAASKPMSNNTMLFALYRAGYHGRATMHGFRATFSTIANENGFSGDVIEKALAHEQRNQVRAAYHRSEYTEQRSELAQWYGDLMQRYGL